MKYGQPYQKEQEGFVDKHKPTKHILMNVPVILFYTEQPTLPFYDTIASAVD